MSPLAALLLAAAPAAETVPGGPRVLTRGPVHEAFAQPWSLAPVVGTKSPKAPPEPVAARPAGADTRWVPGYWHWDEAANEFIWVSGTWRAAPPERRWVPGYWARDGGEWRWVPGYWAGEGEPDRQPVEPPPLPRDPYPDYPVPDGNSFAIPG